MMIPKSTIALTLLLPSLIFAAPKDETVIMEELEVVSTPIVEEQAIRPFGDTVQSVGEVQLEDLAANDLATALDRVPGVTMSRHNPIGAFGGGDGGAIYIRGHGSSRPGQEILTLFDGVPRFSGIWSHSLLDMLPVDGLQGIDVFKSPQGVLFGNSGFGAVNIKPKKHDGIGTSGSFMSAFGRYGTSIHSLSYGGANQKNDYYFSASHRTSDGNRENGKGTVDSFYGRFGEDREGPWSYCFQLLHTSSDVEDPRAINAPQIPIVEKFSTRGDLFVAKISRDDKDSNLDVKLYLDDGLQDWLQWDTTVPEPFYSITDYRNYGIKVKHQSFPWQSVKLILGIDNDFYGGDFVEERNSGNRSDTSEIFHNLAPYFMLSQEISKNNGTVVTPSVGLRYNNNSDFSSETNSHLGLKIEKGKTTLALHTSKSVSYPGIYSAILFGGGPTGNAWKNLMPEEIDHWEAGLSRELSKKCKVQVTYFNDEITNGIKAVFGPGPPQLLNVGEYESKGWEFTFQIEPHDKLSIFLGGTISDTTPDDVPYQPERTCTAGITWNPNKRWRHSVDLRYSDDFFAGNQRFPAPTTNVEGTTIINIRSSRKFTDAIAKNKGEYFIAIENLMDREYELKPGYPMPGRWFTAGVKLLF